MKSRYDTCKVFNLLLVAQGAELYFAESEHLVHIGSISAKVVRGDFLKNKLLARFVHKLPHSQWKHRLLQVAAKKFSRYHIKSFFKRKNDKFSELLVRKSLATRYFTDLINSLLEDRELPQVPIVDDWQVQMKIEQATQALIALYHECENN